jgi:NTP pyrophosphatase (non-canonical NTP hydrolase)
MFNLITEMSDKLGKGSDPVIRMLKFGEEVGEFTVEVAVKTGNCSKPQGPDGVVGEAADVIITCLDIMHKLHPEVTSKQFDEVVKNKLAKWERKHNSAQKIEEADIATYEAAMKAFYKLHPAQEPVYE